MAEEWAIGLYKSQAWRNLRKVLIMERGQRCEHCGKVIADPSKIVADHIQELTPENVANASIALNQENVQLLCYDCHRQKHHRFGRFDQKVFLVYGSPCSGKKERVRHAMFRGDIMIEFDTLYAAVSGCSLHDKPDNIKQVVFRLRDAALDAVITRTGRWATAYVIGGYPRRMERENLARRLGAELMYQDSTIDDCLARARSMGSIGKSMERYVYDWWKVYEP